MSIKFCSLSSDSSGNCYAVLSDTETILIDAGISGKKAVEKLAEIGKSPCDIQGILITHEHSDHAGCAKIYEKKFEKAKFYSSKGTLDTIRDKVDVSKHKPIAKGEKESIGDLTIETFPVSHDACEPIGYVISNDSGKIVIVTDTGCITDDMRNNIEKADILVLEANHETNILKMGNYPYDIKCRILGEMGHLSNETAGECACNFVKKKKEKGDNSKLPQIILAHLSKNNNTPAQAFLTVKNLLEERGFREGKDYILSVAVKDKISPIFEV